jgi:hypothetical protein
MLKQRPLAYVVVSIQNTNVMQLTAIDGKFNFDDLVRGSIGAFHSQGYKDALFPVTIEIGQLLDLGMIMLEEDEILDQQRSLIRLFENELTDDNSGSESTSGLLQSSGCFQSCRFQLGSGTFPDSGTRQ